MSNTSLYPTVTIAEPVTPTLVDTTWNSQQYTPVSNRTNQPVKGTPQASSEAPLNEFLPAQYHAYDRNFDELQEGEKRESLQAMMDMLPSVADMRQYLVRKQQSPLSSWVDRVPPAALGLLRWIIASNRACIMQVDEDTGAIGRKGQDRLYGMPGWSQFRFAMGAPDKERKFITSLRETTDRLKLKYPTLFAWHGSPLQNWYVDLGSKLQYLFFRR